MDLSYPVADPYVTLYSESDKECSVQFNSIPTGSETGSNICHKYLDARIRLMMLQSAMGQSRRTQIQLISKSYIAGCYSTANNYQVYIQKPETKRK